MELLYKKMYRIKTPLGFTAECECGHRHKFGANDINLKKSDATLAIFKNIYTCPNCNAQINGMYEAHEEKKWKQLSLIGVLVSLVLLFGIGFGGYKVIDSIIQSNQPTEFNDMTNRQLQEFKEWEQKQEQREYENSQVND